MTLGRTNINLPEIPIPLKELVLYDYGDECAENSGGWTPVHWRGSLGTRTNEKQADCLYTYGVNNSGSVSALFGWATANKIDFTGFTKLKCIVSGENTYRPADSVQMSINANIVNASNSTSSTTNGPTGLSAAASLGQATSTPLELELDISNIAEDGHVYINTATFGSSRHGKLNIYKVWLEP